MTGFGGEAADDGKLPSVTADRSKKLLPVRRAASSRRQGQGGFNAYNMDPYSRPKTQAFGFVTQRERKPNEGVWNSE